MVDGKGRSGGGGSRSSFGRSSYSSFSYSYSPSRTTIYVTPTYYGGYYYHYYGTTTHVSGPAGIFTILFVFIFLIVVIVLIRKSCGEVVVDDGFSHHGEIMVIEEHQPGHILVVEHHPNQVVVEHSF